VANVSVMVGWSLDWVVIRFLLVECQLISRYEFYCRIVFFSAHDCAVFGIDGLSHEKGKANGNMSFR